MKNRKSTIEEKAEAEYKMAIINFSNSANLLENAALKYEGTVWGGQAKFDRVGISEDELEDYINVPVRHAEGYDVFIKEYPGHKLVPEAMLLKGKAVFCLSGYPEVYSYILRNTKDENKKSEDIHKKYFSEGDYSSRLEKATERVTFKKYEISDAIAIFKEIVSKYSRTEQAKLANYYLGVIREQCYEDKDQAIVYYKKFIDSKPVNKSLINKAKNLIGREFPTWKGGGESKDRSPEKYDIIGV